MKLGDGREMEIDKNEAEVFSFVFFVFFALSHGDEDDESGNGRMFN